MVRLSRGVLATVVKGCFSLFLSTRYFMKNDSLNWVLTVALAFAATACGGTTDTNPGTGGTGGSAGESGTGGSGGTGTARTAMGYVVGDFGFLYPDMDPETYPEMENTDFGVEGVRGFDLDSTVGTGLEPEGCPHAEFQEFNAPDGTPGIDYGLWSFIREWPQLRQGQLVDSVIASSVKNGEMSIVMELGGVDDMVNDDSVTVQIFSTQDSPLVGTDQEVLPNSTLAVHPDSTYHSTIATGTIKDGVLEAGPFDVSLKFFIQIVDSTMQLTDTRIRLELGEGTASGILSANWSVTQIHDIIGKPTSDNGPSPDIGAAGFNYTEFLEAMETPDAGYDQESGTCTAFTTIFRLDAVPAFLTD